MLWSQMIAEREGASVLSCYFYVQVRIMFIECVYRMLSGNTTLVNVAC